jgi:alkylhydroperoxidase/carboxymuconolactone decarboxylase family protein YurZ
MSTTLSVGRSRHRSAIRPRPRDDATEEHTPEYAAILRELLHSAYVLIDALRCDSVDPVLLQRAVADYVTRALNAGISRMRIRDALELLVHDHGGPQLHAAAGAIAMLAMRSPRESVAGAPRSS